MAEVHESFQRWAGKPRICRDGRPQALVRETSYKLHPQAWTLPQQVEGWLQCVLGVALKEQEAEEERSPALPRMEPSGGG